jgi:hypothetical protein
VTKSQLVRDYSLRASIWSLFSLLGFAGATWASARYSAGYGTTDYYLSGWPARWAIIGFFSGDRAPPFSVRFGNAWLTVAVASYAGLFIDIIVPCACSGLLILCVEILRAKRRRGQHSDG